MRKHPLIALTAFTALGASAIAGVSTGTFDSTSVLSSARAHHPDTPIRHDANLTSGFAKTTMAVHLTVSRRDLGVMHDPTRPAGLLLDSSTGRPYVRRHHKVRHKRHIVKVAPVVTTTPPVPTTVVTTTTAPPPPPPTTTPPTTTPPTTVPSVAPAGGVWYELRMCESNDDYSINTGNGFYGAYQFSLATWYGLGFTGLPSDAAPAVQDRAAAELQAESGWGQWPACSAKLGL